MAQQDLTFDIIARDRATATTRNIGRGFSNLGATTKGAFAGMGAAVGFFAVRALGRAARAVADFAADSIRQFAEFDRSMREVWTLLPDLSAAGFAAMQDDVRAFTTEMGIATTEAVPALYQAISAGVPQDNVFEFLTTAAKFSIGGVTSLETAVDGLTSVVNAYGREVISAEQASDIFFTTVRLGKTTAGELSASLFQVIPTASALGIGFETIGAGLAAMASQGVPTSVATTQLRQLLVELNKEGGKTAGLFDDLAGKSFADFIREGGSVQDALALMQEHAENNNTSLSNLFGSVEAGNAALALTSEGGAAAFNTALGEMADASGATDEAFAKMDDGMGRTWDRLQVRIDDLKLSLGEKLAPAIEGILDWFEQLADDSSATGDAISELADSVNSDVDSKIIPALERFGDKTETTFLEQQGAISAFISFMDDVWVFWIDNWGRAGRALTFFKDVAVAGIATVSNQFLTFAVVITESAATAFGWIPGLGGKLRDARDKVREFRDKVNAALGGILTDVNINVNTKFTSSGTPPPGGYGGPFRPFQHGGMIPGPFTGIDRTLIAATPGEFVINREDTQRNLPLLQAINSGQIRAASQPMTAGVAYLQPQMAGRAVGADMPPIRVDVYLDGRKIDGAVAESTRRLMFGSASYRADMKAAVGS